MNILTIVAALALASTTPDASEQVTDSAVSETTTLDISEYGICPGAYVDYEYWETRITRQPPWVVIRRASQALEECREAGINVPRSVHEYNNQTRRNFINRNDLEHMLNPSGRPFFEQ